MLERLKYLRIAVSLLIFLIITVSFINFSNLVPEFISRFFVSLQLLPSILKVITVAGVSIIIPLILIILTVLFGRIYCSSICPLGTLQDIIIFIRRKINKRNYFKYIHEYNIFRYGLLVIVIFTMLSGNIFLFGLLEPYSYFGRIANELFRPTYIGFNNTVAYLLSKFNIYYFVTIQFSPFNFYVISGIIFLLLFIIVLSYKKGRLFCNLLCPAGAILSIFSRLSIFKIKINEDTCKHCKMCEKVCKAGCINSEEMKIDFNSCIACYNCFNVCPTVGLKFKGLFQKKKQKKVELNVLNSRREFISGHLFKITGAALFLLPGFKITENKKSKYDENTTPVAPPGSVSIKHFSELCTACHLCITACPPKVLVPGFLDYGLEGIFQPKMDYNTSYCNYECKICSEVCPTGAILPITLEDKKLTQLGKAFFVKEDCIVETKGTDCGACSEHCPTKAVYMVPYKGKLFIPELNNDICIGCGACQKPCPTKPRKAIFVISNPVHQKAKKPEQEKIEKSFDIKEEFPF